jgi:hypothetical protein
MRTRTTTRTITAIDYWDINRQTVEVALTIVYSPGHSGRIRFDAGDYPAEPAEAELVAAYMLLDEHNVDVKGTADFIYADPDLIRIAKDAIENDDHAILVSDALAAIESDVMGYAL